VSTSEDITNGVERLNQINDCQLFMAVLYGTSYDSTYYL
jgi:hypothetical protein